MRHSGTVTLVAKNAEGALISMHLKAQSIAMPEGVRLVPQIHPEKFLELVMHSYYDARLCFDVGGNLLHAEPLEFTSRLFSMVYDPIKLSTSHHKLPEKLASVAIFTQAYNEGEMLLYWEAYYGKMVGYENLYVLNNGGTDGSCERLNKKTNVINMPASPVDHDHFAQSHGYFLRFLLLKYQWVIKVDTDEFVVSESDLVETLTNIPLGIYIPEKAIEVVHDKEHEAPFDFTRPVCAQRKIFVRGTDALLRPIICGEPATWTPGNHYSHEPNSVIHGFFVVHLKYFDFDFHSSKNIKWALMDQTLNEARTCKQVSGLKAMDAQGLYELSVKENTDRLYGEKIEIPGWLAAKL